MNFIKKLVITAIICLIVIHFMPPIGLPNAVSILAAVTFLFSVIYGFEISIVITNFSQLKTQLATENAQLLSIVHIAQMLGGREGQKTADAIGKLPYAPEFALKKGKKYRVGKFPNYPLLDDRVIETMN